MAFPSHLGRSVGAPGIGNGTLILMIDRHSRRPCAAERILLLIQFVASLAVLAWVPGNLLKAAVLVAIWAATFWPLSVRELVGYLLVSGLFAAMDIGAVRQGVFQFSNPDVLGLPFWEFGMWGFYVLHTTRMLNGPAPHQSMLLTLALAALLAVPFMTVVDPGLLLAASAAALLTALAFFHEKSDLAYLGYMALIGAAVEYAGILSNQWSYPAQPAGGVPLWFITMWGGVGLFARRLVLPLLRSPAR